MTERHQLADQLVCAIVERDEAQLFKGNAGLAWVDALIESTPGLGESLLLAKMNYIGARRRSAEKIQKALRKEEMAKHASLEKACWVQMEEFLAKSEEMLSKLDNYHDQLAAIELDQRRIAAEIENIKHNDAAHLRETTVCH